MYPYPNYQISRNWLKESNDQKWVQKEPTTDPLKPKWKKTPTDISSIGDGLAPMTS